MLSLAVVGHPAELDRVLFTGFCSMFVWLVCFKEQRKSRAFVVGLAISSAALTAFGFLEPGAWPLGFVMAGMTVSVVMRCRKPVAPIGQSSMTHWKNVWTPESRVTRLFGSVGSDN